MTDYNVKVKYQVDSTGLKTADKAAENLTQQLDKAGKEADKLNNELKEGANKASPGIDRMRKGIDGVGEAAGLASGGIGGIGQALSGATALAAPLAIAVVGIGAAALAAVKGFNIIREELGEIKKSMNFADANNIDTTKMAEFAAIAKLAGVNIENLQDAVKTNQAAMFDANKGNEDFIESFTKMGLSIEKLGKMDPLDALAETLKNINKLSGPEQKKMMEDLVGGEYYELSRLIPMLQNMEASKKAAYGAGLVESKEQIELAKAYDKEVIKLDASWESMKRTLLDAFGGDVVEAIGNIASLVNTLADSVRSLNNTMKSLGITGGDLMLASTGPSGALRLLGKMGGNALGFGNDEPTGSMTEVGPEWYQQQYEQSAAAQKLAAENEAAARKENEQIKERLEAQAKADAAAAKAAAERQKAEAEAAASAKKMAEEMTKASESLANVTRTIQQEQKEYILQLSAHVASVRPGGYGALDEASYEATAAAAKRFGGVIGSPLDRDETPGFDGELLRPTVTGLTPEKYKEIAAAAKDTAHYKQLEAQAFADIETAMDDATSKTYSAAVIAQGVAGTERLAQLDAEYKMQDSIASLIENGTVRSQEQLTREIDRAVRLRDAELQSLASGIPVNQELLKQEQEKTDKINARAREGERALERQLEMTAIMDGFIDGVGNAFTSSITEGLVNGRMEFDDFLKDISRMLIDSSIKMLFAKLFEPSGAAGDNGWLGYIQKGLQLWNTWTGATGGGTTTSSPNTSVGPRQANGGAWLDGIQMFANGGVVNNATLFNHAAGTGMMGEAGPEAIMPLTRGPNGKLGVQAHGGGNTQVINLGDTTINVQSTNDAARDDRETAKAIEKMMEQKMAKWMAEQRRSGNSLNSAFGARY